MSLWSSIAATANISFFAVGGETVSYSRPAGAAFDAVTAFDTTAVPDLSPEMAAPDAKERVLMVRIADIPLGPQKGDLIVYLGREYKVFELFPTKEDGTANIGIRWTGL